MEDGHTTSQLQAASERVLESLSNHAIEPSRLTLDGGSAYSQQSRLTITKGILRAASPLFTESTVVTVKTLRAANATEQIGVLARFAREVRLWSRLDHPNVLSLLGHCVDTNSGRFNFVMPSSQRGSMREILSTGMSTSTLQRLSWLRDATGALAYMHSLDPPIVHGAFTADHIWVMEDNRALLGDFSCSRDFSPDDDLLVDDFETEGFTAWHSPERLLDHIPSQEDDVWAWAFTALEVMTGRQPWYFVESEAACRQRIIHGPPVERSLYPELDERSPLWTVIEACLGSRKNRERIDRWKDVVDNLVTISEADEHSVLPLVDIYSHLDRVRSKLRLVKRLKRMDGTVSDSFKAFDLVACKIIVVKKLPIKKDVDEWLSSYSASHLNVLGEKREDIVPLVLASLGESAAFTTPWYPKGDIWTFVHTNPLADPSRLIRGFLEAITFLHGKGIIHASIKPDNVLVDDADRPRLCDIGVTKVLENSMQPTDVVGTMDQARWAAPEVLDGAPFDTASDIYSAALVTLSVLTRKVPFPKFLTYGVLSRERSQTPSPAESDYPELGTGNMDQTLWFLLDQCWKTDPVSRPSARNLRKGWRSLRGVLAGSTAMKVDISDTESAIEQSGSGIPTSMPPSPEASKPPYHPAPDRASIPSAPDGATGNVSAGEAQQWDIFVDRARNSHRVYTVQLDVRASGPSNDVLFDWTAIIKLEGDGQEYMGQGVSESYARNNAAGKALLSLA